MGEKKRERREGKAGKKNKLLGVHLEKAGLAGTEPSISWRRAPPPPAPGKSWQLPKAQSFIAR